MHSHFTFKPEEIEQYFLDLMAGRRRRWFDRVLIDLLFVASRFYRMAVQFRLWMYDKRVIRKEELLDVVAAEAGKFEVVLMVGAGNIELLVDPVKQILDKKE